MQCWLKHNALITLKKVQILEGLIVLFFQAKKIRLLSENIHLLQILYYDKTFNIHVKIPYWEWILRNLHYVFLHLLPTVQSSNILLSEQCFKNPLPPRWIWIVSSIIVESSSSDSLRLRFKQIDDSIHAWILLLMLASAFLSLFSPSSYSSLKAKCELKFF